uniref:Uncharacterized protein n=1 Tax=Romanomermis culicivorax TaxID=13658 RepID=A0A915HZ25_ROMCU
MSGYVRRVAKWDGRQIPTAETTEVATPCEEFNDTVTESYFVSSSQPIISNVSSTSKEGIIVGIFNESSSQPSVTSSLITKAQESGKYDRDNAEVLIKCNNSPFFWRTCLKLYDSDNDPDPTSTIV